MDPNDIDMTVAAKSEREVAVAILAREAVPTDKPVLLQLHWTMGFDLADKDSLSLSGTKDIPLRPSSVDLIRTVAPEFEQPLSVAAVQPPKDFTLRYTMDGSTPTVSSAVYERPLAVDKAATVKARFFNKCGPRHRDFRSNRTSPFLPVPVSVTAFIKAAGRECRTSAN